MIAPEAGLSVTRQCALLGIARSSVYYRPRFGKAGIFNTDQGAQFTSHEFTQMLQDHRIEISMDGRGRCHDNIFVERLWWTVKHEWVYLRPAANGIEQKPPCRVLRLV